MFGSPLTTIMTEAQISANNKLAGKANEASNKVNEHLQRSLNLQKGIQKDAFVTSAGTAATIGATVATAKSGKVQEVLSESFKPIKEAFSNSNFGKEAIKTCSDVAETAKSVLKEGTNWVKNLPKPAKAILGIGTAVTAIASTIVHRQTEMKDNQIIREYAEKQGAIKQQYK